MASKVANIIAPSTSELGGGIAKAAIGETTDRYEKYFDGDESQPTEDLQKKRLLNYADVVVRLRDDLFFFLCESYAQHSSAATLHVLIPRSNNVCRTPTTTSQPPFTSLAGVRDVAFLERPTVDFENLSTCPVIIRWAGAYPGVTAPTSHRLVANSRRGVIPLRLSP